MYESHFGITGLPFQLNPDPSFYFDSRGHRSALAYLKFGVHQGEGFIVVTGDIGAGKTTLVRTLLSELDPDKVVAAQIVSTQLEAGDLLRAIVTSFGIPSRNLTKADLISTIEGFLTALAAKGRRALLIVDEAQNLNREAIEELRMLSNFQLGSRSLLQSFLVGQPELRSLLLSKPMEQFRQRVIASCHLGPLDTTETRAYIEHRLHKVGWKFDPSFAPSAFDEIYRWTAGVPRRINILCNRLMLATFLSGEHAIDAQAVERTARELRSEVGDSNGPSEMPLSAVVAPRVVAPHSTSSLGSQRAEGPRSDLRFAEPTPSQPAELDADALTALADDSGPLLCVVASRSDCVKIAPLLKHLRSREGLPGVRLVHAGHADDDLFAELDLQVPDVCLEVLGGSHARATAEVMLRFEPVLEAVTPSAVLIIAGSDAAVACALVASKRHVAVVSLESGLRSFARSESSEINRVVTDHLADVLYTTVRSAQYTLVREGVADKRVRFVGNLLADSVRSVWPHAIQPQDTLRRLGVDIACLSGSNGYGVVAIQHESNIMKRGTFSQVLAVLHLISNDLPLVWPMHPRTRAQLDLLGVGSVIAEARITLLPAVSYREMVGLMARSTCVITDSGEVQEEATVLTIPCMTMLPHTERLVTVDEGSNIVVGRSRSLLKRAVADTLRYGGKKGKPPEFWDGDTAKRIAEHLVTWLRERSEASPNSGAAQAA